MKSISEQEYEKLTANGKVLEVHENNPKVLSLPDNRYFKAFFHKSWFSGSHIISRASKFARNANKLKQKGITTIDIEDVFKLKRPTRHCVVYQGVSGITLRQALESSPQDTALCQQVGSYIAELHDKGIMFRSLHLGNVIVMPNQALALIDISDMQVNRTALSRWERERNFLHVLRYREDKDLLDLEAFSKGYQQEDQSQQFSGEDLLQLLQQTLPKAER
jgi:tRNA A-37 threonylcarbamoyl transferase component Bud32